MKPRAIALLLLLTGLLLSALYPAGQYVSQRGKIAELSRQVGAIEAQVADASAEVARLRTDAEVERLARERLGMVRPGEVSFAIASGDPIPAAGR